MSGSYDENLAYGEDYGTSRGSSQQTGDRGILGDIGKKLKSKYDQYQASQGQGQAQQYGHGTGNYQYGSQPGTTSPAGAQYGPQASQGGQYAPTQQYQSTSYVQEGQGTPQPGYVPPHMQENPNYAGRKPDLVSKVFDGLQGTFQSIGSDVSGLLGGNQYQPQPYAAHNENVTAQGDVRNRYGSFASERGGNDAKWYVDGAGYVSSFLTSFIAYAPCP